MIYLKYRSVVAATGADPVTFPDRSAGAAPAQDLWADDVDDAAYYLAHAHLRAEDEGAAPPASA
jgi:hypothetical protein